MKDIFKTFMKHQEKLGILAIVLLVASLVIVANQYTKSGDVFDKDITLKGGVSATLYTTESVENIQKILDENYEQESIVRGISEFGTDTQIGVLIEMEDVKADDLRAVLEKNLGVDLNDENFSFEQVSSTLGKSFSDQMKWAMLIAFLFMAIVVFITFRVLVPSGMVVLSAFFDIIATIAVIDLMGMRVSTSGIAALLLLIGYSVDTDILLTTKVLKRKEEGTLDERIIGSIKTGLTMTITTIVALTVGYFISNSVILQQMFLIIIIGCIFDIIATYGLNVYLLKWYVKRKEKNA